jgi:hypothetical protein
MNFGGFTMVGTSVDSCSPKLKKNMVETRLLSATRFEISKM